MLRAVFATEAVLEDTRLCAMLTVKAMEALIQHEKAASDLQLAMGELLETRRLKFQLH